MNAQPRKAASAARPVGLLGGSGLAKPSRPGLSSCPPGSDSLIGKTPVKATERGSHRVCTEEPTEERWGDERKLPEGDECFPGS